jgi:hypothetical protein
MEANLLRNTETFTKMDPFCVVTHYGKEYKTRTIDEAGMKVKWEEEIDFNFRHIEEDVKIAVFDEDYLWNDLVGETTIKVDDLLKLKEGWIKIFFKNEEAGQVKLKCWITCLKPMEKSIE